MVIHSTQRVIRLLERTRFVRLEVKAFVKVARKRGGGGGGDSRDTSLPLADCSKLTISSKIHVFLLSNQSRCQSPPCRR